NKLLGFEMPCHGSRCRVRIDVEPAAGVIDGQRGNHRHDAGSAEILNQGTIDARDLADTAQVDGLAIGARQLQPFAEETLEWARMQTAGPPAQVANSSHDAGVDFFTEDANDDGESLLVGIAAALNFPWLKPRGRHGPIDRLAAAVDEHRPHTDRGHEG